MTVAQWHSLFHQLLNGGRERPMPSRSQQRAPEEGEWVTPCWAAWACGGRAALSGSQAPISHLLSGATTSRPGRRPISCLA
eukprot:8024108-Pyramimonas_sp.AAC.1